MDDEAWAAYLQIAPLAKGRCVEYGDPKLHTSPERRSLELNLMAAQMCVSCPAKRTCAEYMDGDVYTIHGGNAEGYVRRGGRHLGSKAHANLQAGTAGEAARCEVCGVEFVRRNKLQRGCGAEACTLALKRARKSMYLTEGSCVECGQPFKGKSSQKYCGRECYLKAGAKRWKEYDARRNKITVTRTCEWCGKDFATRKHRPAATCSRGCTTQLCASKRRGRGNLKRGEVVA